MWRPKPTISGGIFSDSARIEGNESSMSGDGIEPRRKLGKFLNLRARDFPYVCGGAISDGRLYRDSTREAADVFALV